MNDKLISTFIPRNSRHFTDMVSLMFAQWKSIIHETTASDLRAAGRALREPHQVVSL